MTDKPRDARYQVSADRESAVRRVRYVETNRGDADECTLCQLDEGVIESAAGSAQIASEPQDEQQPETEEAQFVRQQLFTAIENQLRDNDPPFVQSVLNKLVLVGIGREEAVEMMAYILSLEIQKTLSQDRGFDVQNYEKMLRALPDLPDDEDA